jgi:eukaryotic-like serine/threonine-protein kinase
MAANDRLAENQLFGKYRIVRLMGEGGMGAVYEAVHPVLKKRFAVKTLLPTVAVQRDARARFLREAEAASRINHPNVVAVLDVGTEGDTPYLVMEFLEGETLDALLARRTVLPVADAVDLMLPVISAVSTAHEHGVIHRDLKPQNIFLARGPWGEAIPKVLDFGVSKLVDDREAVALTGTQAMLGTVTYMSPEQARGARGVDARSDQYAIGLILYEMVTGARAHPGESALEILHHIANGVFVPPRTARPELSVAIEAVLLRCLAVQPRDRYPSLRALGQALLPHAGEKARAALADGFRDLGAVTEVAGAVPIAARAASPPPRVSPSAPGAREAEATALGLGAASPPSQHPSAGSTQILPGATQGRNIDTTFREVAAEVSPPPHRKAVVGSKVRVVVVSVVAVGAAAGIAFLLATGSLSSRGAPATPAPQESAQAPAPVPVVAPAAPAAAIPTTPPVSPAPTAAHVHVRRLDVRALPAQAQLSLDGGRPVQGRLQRDVSDDAASHTLLVTADGFQEQMISFGAEDALPSQVTLKRLPDSAAQRPHPRRAGGHAAISTGRAAGPAAVPDEPLVPAAAPAAPAARSDAPPAAPRRGANNSLILK